MSNGGDKYEFAFSKYRSRKGKNWTFKRKICKGVRRSTKTYYNWLNGVNPIPSNILMKMSDLCGVKIDYLLGRVMDEEKDAT